MKALRSRIISLLTSIREKAVNYSMSSNDVSGAIFLAKNRPLNEEGKTLCKKLLFMVDQMKKDWKVDRWVRMPQST
jgi:hypothetical protein